LRIGCATVFLLFLSVSGFAQESPPPTPTDWFDFAPGFDTGWGVAPLAYTSNLISAPMCGGYSLILDTTNLTPAYLNYQVQENIYYPNGTILFCFAPNWASVSQGGTGPGETAYFFGGGDWSSNSPGGLFAIYADAGGSNIYFGGVEAGDFEVYASAPISWSSNTFHQIGVEWTEEDCEIYLDSALAATGDGIIYVPAHSTWTNGIFIGSDNTGYEQARGAFFGMETWEVEFGGSYTNGWLDVSNAIAAWQATLVGGGFGMGMGAGILTPAGPCTNCLTGTGVCITNMTAMPDANGDGGTTFVFTIEGGTNGMAYNVYSITNLWTNNITNAVWTWLGQGTNCGTYSVTNQPMNQSFYLLGGTLPTNGNQQDSTNNRENVFVVYAQPITSTGNLGTCPGPYAGYVNYTPTNGDWGFAPLTNTTVFTAGDTNRTNTRVEYVGDYGDSGCAQTTVTIPNPPYSPAYRFSIYFTNDVPSTNYPITLSGFSP
jgi:hypothetical protein